jgi:hypothetical protein
MLQEDLGPGAVTADKLWVPLGFVVHAYSADRATVTIYFRGADGTEGSCSTDVVWGAGAGDWLLELETDGAPWRGCVFGAPPGGHVSWGPA